MPGAAEDRCARRVSVKVVDRNGLPARCLRASRPRNTSRRGGPFSLHFAPKSIFCARPLGVAAPGRRALGPRATGPIFGALGCFTLNCPSIFVSGER